LWLDAFPAASLPDLEGLLSLCLVLASILLSVAAFARLVGPQYELKGRRLGIPLAIAGILGYLVGTSFASPLLHTVSIATFYWGSVLYLSGTRTFISTLPSGVLVVLLAVPSINGATGLIYLDEFAWALLVISALLLWVGRQGPASSPCSLCTSFSEKGRSFCSSCGRYLTPLAAPPSSRLVKFTVFTVVMLAALSVTVPLLVATPTASLENYSIGGPRATNHFAPLAGWGVRTAAISVNGTRIYEYSLTNGGASMEALVAESGDPQAAATALNSTRSRAVPDTSVPPSIANAMSGYTFTSGRTKYVGLDGVFQVGSLNGSSLSETYVAVDLRQTSFSFGVDHGSTLYSTASNVISWATGSGSWFTTAQTLLMGYQLFSQTAYVGLFGVFGVVLFTLARDDELAKVQRVESMHALGVSEVAVLEAFGTNPGPMKGEAVRDEAWRTHLWFSDDTFFSSLDEVARRGLVSPSVILEKGRPTLYWRRLV
jgi:hypothetical protein